jgi:hypothetical protein
MADRDAEQQVFDQVYDELIRELPAFLARALARLREPNMKWVRIGTGAVLVLGGSLAFLPVLGLEMLPLGLLLLAQDIECLRKPTARLLSWLVTKLRELKQRWRRYQPPREPVVLN